VCVCVCVEQERDRRGKGVKRRGEREREEARDQRGDRLTFFFLTTCSLHELITSVKSALIPLQEQS
jgi:hypothetical protein